MIEADKGRQNSTQIYSSNMQLSMFCWGTPGNAIKDYIYAENDLLGGSSSECRMLSYEYKSGVDGGLSEH